MAMTAHQAEQMIELLQQIALEPAEIRKMMKDERREGDRSPLGVRRSAGTSERERER